MQSRLRRFPSYRCLPQPAPGAASPAAISAQARARKALQGAPACCAGGKRPPPASVYPPDLPARPPPRRLLPPARRSAGSHCPFR
ncbi:DUF3035 domain-containing protein [Pantoea sp. Z09]|uniref:DUF3035 domain-containing protein n=1 Tax=Pantoea sp. Z09 TaxID=2886821 RepID=UPI00353025DA